MCVCVRERETDRQTDRQMDRQRKWVKERERESVAETERLQAYAYNILNPRMSESET